MITIKPTQWKSLSDASLLLFEDEMVKHLTGFAPDLAKVMGRLRLQQLVKRGVQRGRSYGLTNRGPLRSYLETMLALGSDFDTDPTLLRATASLRDEDTDQPTRAAALHGGVLDYLEQVNGAENEHLLAALGRVKELSFEALQGKGNLGDRALAMFHGGFPQKYSYAGDAALRELLVSAARISNDYALQTGAGRLVVAFMIFAFGHGVFSDPAYSWADEAMRNSAIPEEERPRLVHRKARLYLSAVLENLKG